MLVSNRTLLRLLTQDRPLPSKGRPAHPFNRLRRKPRPTDHIKTVRGAGYSFVAPRRRDDVTASPAARLLLLPATAFPLTRLIRAGFRHATLVREALDPRALLTELVRASFGERDLDPDLDPPGTWLHLEPARIPFPDGG